MLVLVGRSRESDRQFNLQRTPTIGRYVVPLQRNVSKTSNRNERTIGMRDRCEQDPIVVGVDGSASAWDALDWSAAEASAMHRPLRIVHSFRSLMQVPFGPSGLGPADGGVHAVAERVLIHAEARAQSAAPDVKVTCELVDGTATSALLHRALDAELVAVGSRGLGGFSGLLVGSVGVALAANAPCPVVIVRPRTSDCYAPATGRVVVGTDGSGHSAAAMRFAFQAAARRKRGLTAVRVWKPPLSGYRRLVVGLDSIAADERQELWRTLEPHRRAFPEVVAMVKLVRAPLPGQALIRESTGADLVVVGSHGHGGFAGPLLGSVSQSVLEHAKCPVVVVKSIEAGLGR
jgi:nucleotide-binding universal stress UspA family protein